MDVVFAILDSVASEACCLFCCSMVQFKSNRKDLEDETQALVELKVKVTHEVETCERDGKSVKPRVKKWLGEVEKFLDELKPLETSIKDFEKRQFRSRCSCTCSQRCKLSKEVGMMLKKVSRLTLAGSLYSGKVDHGPGPSTEDQKTA